MFRYYRIEFPITGRDDSLAHGNRDRNEGTKAKTTRANIG
jgi:hypothetical protein